MDEMQTFGYWTDKTGIKSTEMSRDKGQKAPKHAHANLKKKLVGTDQ